MTVCGRPSDRDGPLEHVSRSGAIPDRPDCLGRLATDGGGVLNSQASITAGLQRLRRNGEHRVCVGI
jgi:hypothetical protein